MEEELNIITATGKTDDEALEALARALLFIAKEMKAGRAEKIDIDEEPCED